MPAALTATLEDAFGVKKSGSAGRSLATSLADGLVVDTDDFQGLFLAEDDSGTYLDDDATVSCIQYVIPISRQAYESGQWFLQDDLSVYAVVNRQVEDAIYPLDGVATSISRLLEVADPLGLMYDATSFIFGNGLSSGDALSISDGISPNAGSANLAAVVADTFVFLDYASASIPSTGLTSYLRRYLNDVVR